MFTSLFYFFYIKKQFYIDYGPLGRLNTGKANYKVFIEVRGIGMSLGVKPVCSKMTPYNEGT